MLMESIKQVSSNSIKNLQTIERGDLTKTKNLKQGAELARQTIVALRTIVLANNCFKTIDDEIYFFKNIKPSISGRYQFFGKLLKFQSRWPNADIKSQKRYVRQALEEIELSKSNSIDFWRYLKGKETKRDGFYFLRGNYEIGVNCDMSNYIVDPEFSTGYDILTAEFVASDLLSKHYKKILVKLRNKEPDNLSDLIIDKNRTWSGSKTDLIELLYALHALGVFNNGQAEIKRMIMFCEATLNIELRNPYKTLIEIKARKTSKTKFLDSLAQALIKKLDADDGYYQ